MEADPLKDVVFRYHHREQIFFGIKPNPGLGDEKGEVKCFNTPRSMLGLKPSTQDRQSLESAVSEIQLDHQQQINAQQQQINAMQQQINAQQQQINALISRSQEEAATRETGPRLPSQAIPGAATRERGPKPELEREDSRESSCGERSESPPPPGKEDCFEARKSECEESSPESKMEMQLRKWEYQCEELIKMSEEWEREQSLSREREYSPQREQEHRVNIPNSNPQFAKIIQLREEARRLGRVNKERGLHLTEEYMSQREEETKRFVTLDCKKHEELQRSYREG